MNHKEEIAFLTEQGGMIEQIDNDELAAAIKTGLTLNDWEWNQRLGRPFIFHPTDMKAEIMLREEYFVQNGLDAATAKVTAAAMS